MAISPEAIRRYYLNNLPAAEEAYSTYEGAGVSPEEDPVHKLLTKLTKPKTETTITPETTKAEVPGEITPFEFTPYSEKYRKRDILEGILGALLSFGAAIGNRGRGEMGASPLEFVAKMRGERKADYEGNVKNQAIEDWVTGQKKRKDINQEDLIQTYWNLKSPELGAKYQIEREKNKVDLLKGGGAKTALEIEQGKAFTAAYNALPEDKRTPDTIRGLIYQFFPEKAPTVVGQETDVEKERKRKDAEMRLAVEQKKTTFDQKKVIRDDLNQDITIKDYVITDKYIKDLHALLPKETKGEIPEGKAGAIDNALMKLYTQVIEPGLAVRQDDVSLMVGGQAMLQRWQEMAKAWISGGLALSPPYRMAMIEAAEKMYEITKERAKSSMKMHVALADEYGLEKNQIFSENLMNLLKAPVTGTETQEEKDRAELEALRKKRNE